MASYAPPLAASTFSGQGTGELRWLLGRALADVRLTGAQTGGQLCLVELLAPKGELLPRCAHEELETTLVVLEGVLALEVDGEAVQALPGTTVHVPRGVAHRIAVETSTARLFVVGTPGAYEELVRALSVPATARTLPAPGQAPALDRAALERKSRITRALAAEVLEEPPFEPQVPEP